MKRAVAAVAVAACALVLSSSACALTMREYFQDKKAGGQDWLSDQIFLSGVASGLKVANFLLADRKDAPLFCAPGMTLTFDNLTDILEREYSSTVIRWTDDMHAEIIMEAGLVNTFPCERRAK